MKSKNQDFKDIFDVYGFRVIVNDIDTCYRLLGVMHSLYKPKPGRIKDYIAIPKANGYQSLHTSLIGPRRMRIEVQLRTVEMEKMAEAGIAAHWMYKENEQVSNVAQARAREWIKGLMEMQRTTGSPLEFIENVKIDLQPDEVYVFTPKGDIMKLPRGATVLDFAYAVHSGVGDGCIAAMVDHRLTPLRTILSTGQTIEIITAPGARPNPAWLDFAVTARARTAIRQSLKRLKGEAAIALGRRLLDQSLATLNLTVDTIPEAQLQHALAGLGVGDLEGLLEEVGLGQRMPWLVAQRLSGVTAEQLPPDATRHNQRLLIRGTEGAVVSFARCCHPIPGDPIVGFASAGRGVVIHHRDCANVREYRNQPDKWVDVQWESEVQGEFPVVLTVDVVNRRGVLAELATTISDTDSNIEQVAVDERQGMVTTIRFTFTVRDRVHLAQVMRRLRVLHNVVKITRRR
jgi:guanosine-3',5'-bis(diphosphate) 3'-pyrophosphohydrolase